MDFVINKIVDIEKQAQNIKDEAENAKNNLQNEIASEIVKMEKQFEEDLNSKIKAFNDNELKDEQQKTKELDDKHNEKLLSFKNEFTKNIEEWENRLYKSIIQSSVN